MQMFKEKLAYSKIGKMIATMLQASVYKQSRTHWIQDCFAGYKKFSSLK